MFAATLWISLALSQPGPDPPKSEVPGQRGPLTVGQLFVPDGLQAVDGPIGLIVHLHGAGSLMERNLSLAHPRRVLVTVSLNGLSSVYTNRFDRPDVFVTLVREAAARTGPLVGSESFSFQSTTVSSFSAGFGGVRELLKSPECYRLIDAIVMADSIYAGYTADQKDRGVDPEKMAGFLQFARDAAAGRKRMVISHCELQPDGYASTAETADYLLRELKLTRQTVDETWADQWRCTSRCQQGGFSLFGFAGTAGGDHLRHLHHIGQLWRAARP